jgi:uroporphyrin-III C-methyltransferase
LAGSSLASAGRHEPQFVPAPSAAAASANVSLTLRGAARRVQFVTAHARAGEPLDLNWRALADPQATTAFYMGRAAAAEIGRNLVAASLPGETPVLIACDVSLPQQSLLQTRLDLLELAVKAIAEERPTLILVGAAVETDAQAMPIEVAAKAD